MSINFNNPQEMYDKATAFDSVWEVLEMLGFDESNTNTRKEIIVDLISNNSSSVSRVNELRSMFLVALRVAAAVGNMRPSLAAVEAIRHLNSLGIDDVFELRNGDRGKVSVHCELRDKRSIVLFENMMDAA